MPTDAQYHRLLPAFGHKAMCRRLGVSAGLTGRFARNAQGKRAIAQHGAAKPAEPAEPAVP